MAGSTSGSVMMFPLFVALFFVVSSLEGSLSSSFISTSSSLAFFSSCKVESLRFLLAVWSFDSVAFIRAI